MGQTLCYIALFLAVWCLAGNWERARAARRTDRFRGMTPHQIRKVYEDGGTIQAERPWVAAFRPLLVAFLATLLIAYLVSSTR